MILRALFWIAVVSVLMPHGPDLGLAPKDAGAAAALPGPVAHWVSNTLGAPQRACADHAKACATTLGAVDSFQAMAVRGLDDVRAEIEADQRARARGEQLADND